MKLTEAPPSTQSTRTLASSGHRASASSAGKARTDSIASLIARPFSVRGLCLDEHLP
jgi:hypothetical protein